MTFRSRIRRGFAQPGAYLTQAGILPIPELAILPRKRFWSGAMTEKKLLQILGKKKPEVLVLYKARIQSSKQWQAFLKKDYTMIVDNPVVVLYVNKGLIPQGSNWKIDLLRNLDL